MKKNFKNIFLAKVFFYLFIGFLCLNCTAFFATSARAETYPQLDISGYKKYEYKNVEVKPISNYFLGISQVGYSPTYSGGPWQERLMLMISGKLSQRLTVGYDLEQQPETPDKYDVSVQYDKHKLTFGDINTKFTGNDFASVSKYVNGVMFESKDSWYDLTFVPSAKGRSQTQGLTTQNGNNTRGPYNLGHGSIVEGTEHIELNGVSLVKGIDYTIDYFEGQITFSEILTSDDEFSYSYEYTNILDLFFPSLSKREFFGIQNRFSVDPREIGQPIPEPTPVVLTGAEVFPTSFDQPELIEIEASTLEAISSQATMAAASTLETVTFVKPKSKVVVEPFVPVIPKGEDRAKYYEVQEGDTLSDIVIKSENQALLWLWKKAISHPDNYDLFYKVIADALGLEGPDMIREGQRLRMDQLSEKDLERALNYELKIWGTPVETKVNGLKDVEGRNVVTIESTTDEIEDPTSIVYVEGFGFILPGPSTFEVYKQKILEEEASGHYQLANAPVDMFTEEIQFGGRLLLKDEDYIIDYAKGTVNLITGVLPTAEDPMVITYSYSLASFESEKIDGVGSRGPYNLKYANVIAGSEKITIDEIPAIRDLDYIINYEQGKLVFNFAISESSQIVARYQHQVMKMPQSLPEKDKHKFTFGATYLREKAEQGATAPTQTAIESFTGSDVRIDDYTLYLSNFPIVPTTEATFTVRLNGVDLSAEADYVIPITSLDPATGYSSVEPYTVLAYLNDRTDLSDGYDTGTVKLLTTVEATDEVTVVYSYYKSIVGQYNNSGNGSRGPYYIRNYRNLVPGSETVQVWQQGSSNLITYTRNGSFDADSGATGYAINYYQDMPYITFNEVLDTDYNFSVIFQYVAEDSGSGEDLVKDVIGFDTSIKLGEKVDLSAAYARSSTDQVIVTVATIEAFDGDGNRTYTLNSVGDIVENSDVVKVNDIVQNRDLDYYFNYSAPGQIVFYYITPSSLDAIVVNYDYKSTGSGSTGQLSEKLGSAYKLAGSSKLGSFTFSGDLKQVDNDFTAMGGAAVGQGSTLKNYKISYVPSATFNLASSLRETKDLLRNETNKYKYGYDCNTSLAFSPFGAGDAKVIYRHYLTNEDLIGTSLRKDDTLLESWDTNYSLPKISKGEFEYTNNNIFRNASTKYDYFDQQSPSSKLTNYFKTSNIFKFTERFAFTFDHQISEPITTTSTDETGVTTEVEAAHTLSRDTTYDFTLNLTRAPFKKWSTRFKFINHEGLDLVSTAEAANTRNETYHMDFDPTAWLLTTYDHNRQETLTVVVGGTNPKTEKTSSTVKLLPHSSTALQWAGAWDDAYYATGSHTKGNSNTYTVNYTPISVGYLKLDSKFVVYDRNALAPSGTYEVTTDTESFTQTYTLTYLPFSILKVIPSFVQEDYLNYNDSTVSAVYTKTQNQTTGLKVTYTPFAPIDLTSNYDLKVTKNLLDDINRHKAILKLGSTYRIYTWGTLSYDWTKEDNQGEVQAGSLTDLDLNKTIDQIALSVTIPQNNVILSSIVFKVAYKHVNYINNLSASDNFDASLLSFEGTLNF